MMRGRLDLIQEPQKSAAEIEALAEQTAQFNTVMEELAQVGMGLAISFGPLVSLFKDFLQFLSPMIENLDILIYSLGAYAIMTKGAAIGTLLWKGSVEALTYATKRNILLAGLAIFLPLLASVGPVFKGIAIALGVVAAAIWALSAAEKSTVILGGIWVIGAVIAAIAALVHSLTVGNSPSLVEAFYMTAAAIPFMTLALLGLMPLLPALLLLVPPLALGFALIAGALTDLLSDQLVTNLQLMSVEIANIVASINELSATKALAFTTTMVATSTAAAAAALTSPGALSAAALTSPAERSAAVAGTAGGPAGGPAGAPAGAPAFVGPPPTININLSIDGKEFGTVVNSVEVSKYNSGKQSNLYDSVLRMMEQGLITGKHS